MNTKTQSLNELREASIKNWNIAVDLTAQEKTAWAAENRQEAMRLGALAWYHIKAAVLFQQEYLAFGGEL